MHRSARRWLAISLAGLFFVTTACTSGGPEDSSSSQPQGDFGGRPGCEKVFAAVSSEKVNLFTALSDAFQNSEQAKNLTKCADIIPTNVASGTAARLLNAGWPENETDQPKPVIWSPASTSWTSQVADSRGASLVANPVSFARTPLVFAMPEQMARTLGWPSKPVGYKTLHDLCLDPNGWGRFGGSTALWGPFRLAKTNPFSSTSGLNTLLGQSYAASGKKDKLTEADVSASKQFSKDFESCVIHYGDTTGNVLQRLYERDQDGRSLGYVSAVAVEETSIVNYNLGNPTSSVVEKGQKLTPPRKRLVAVYPPEGSLQSNNPLVVLGPDANWITPAQRKAATAFQQFVVTPPAQALLGDYGFRPVNPSTKPGGLITPENGVDPTQPKVQLPNPPTPVIAAAQQAWNQFRKGSKVLFLMDVSGSMDEDAGDGKSRMDLAIKSTQDSLDHFRPSDEVGVWAFTTGLKSSVGEDIAVVHPVEAGHRETLKQDIGNLTPLDGTPLYDATWTAYKDMKRHAEPGRINAIIVLSDGEDTDSSLSLDQLTAKLRSTTEGEEVAPVRIFPIVFSQDAAPQALTDMAEASGGQVFNASDPRRLSLVMQQVVNNF
jgi:Ca-activated chloride channel family protein